MGRKSDVRQKVIDVASELFWHQGYETTGVAAILEKAGIGSGSLYWFFKTKEDLLRAVLDSYRHNARRVPLHETSLHSHPVRLEAR